jgi:hypothetical protein
MSTVEASREAPEILPPSILPAMVRATEDLEALAVLLAPVGDAMARASDDVGALLAAAADLAQAAALVRDLGDRPAAAAPAHREREVVAAELRARPLAQRLPERWHEVAGNVQVVLADVSVRSERSVERVRAAATSLRRSVHAGIELLAERPQLHRSARTLVRSGVALALAGVFAVQVLGIGRSPNGDTVAAVAPGPAAAAPAPIVGPEQPAPAPQAPAPQGSGPQAFAPQPVEPITRNAPPIALRVPAISVDAPVVIVGLEPDGAMEIPSDVRTVGWYEPFPGAGVIPGERGTAVIAGHVDSRVQGRGAFWPLRELRPGDVVEVLHEDGTSTRWRVDDVVRYPKTDIPIEEIFTFDGDERLALITCGGEFDRSLGEYLDNYVVFASPQILPFSAGIQPLPASP